ncbi:MAG: tetratricopeptide repeat protein [Gammaproteobacteria bacterium]|nr:tetratricopeptide repeat protein [Gammaproteobacteria bacterium]MDE2347268.1 tetratricopeptide repeat protein [Gammaproteobacteria bacterium]
MPLIVLSLLIQIALIVHVLRTGRNTLWILAIALLPFAGSLAYLLVEILPDQFGSGARRAQGGLSRFIDPERRLRRARAEVEVSGNVDARRRLAEELYRRGQYERAIDTCRGGLSGVFEHDPTLLLELARASFARQDFTTARDSLERLVSHNPDFKSADARLLYARTLEAAGALDESLRHYASIAPEFPGAEARLRYGLLLKRVGRIDEANREFRELLEGAKLAPAHYRRAQAEWLGLARRELG